MTRVEKEKKFLKEILDEDLKTIRLAPWQNKVLVDDPETFQKIALKADIDEIFCNRDRLYFSYDLLGLTSSTHTWSYELTEGKELFLDKYGDMYRHK
ncbi:MAG: hypothetical protein ACQESG_02255 [Nanobdellota archaeon]